MVPIWSRVGELIDRAPSLPALRIHRLHLLAAARWRAAGHAVPVSLREDERLGAMIATAAPLLLKRARAAYPGQLVLMKGPEVAALYPDPATRFYRDLDLLCDDAPAAQRALLDAGFVVCGDPDDTHDHHLTPLGLPGLPLLIELHGKVNRPGWLEAPSREELIERAVPSATGIEGILAPPPDAHALLLAGHSWAHQPLRRVIDLVDVALMLSAAEPADADALARRWVWSGMWNTTLAAIDGILLNRDGSTATRSWARHLSSVRERTVLEEHVAPIGGVISALPARRAPRAVAVTLARAAAPMPGEGWPEKLRRIRMAIAHARMAGSQHHRLVLGEQEGV